MSYAAALMASTTGPPNNNGAVVSSGSGVREKPTGLRPVGLQGDTAAEDDAAAGEEDECTEAEILGELSLEILRRRLNGQIGRLRRKEKKLQRQREDVVAQQAVIDEQKMRLVQLENETATTKEEITAVNAVIHTFSSRISELSGTDEQPSSTSSLSAPLNLATAPPHLLEQIRHASDGALQLVQHNVEGTAIDSEAVTKQLVNMALLLQAVLPPRPTEPLPGGGIVGLSTHGHTTPIVPVHSEPEPVRSPTQLPRRELSSNRGLSSLSAASHSSVPAPASPSTAPLPTLPDPVPPEGSDMQVVGQCPGDKRKLDDVLSAEAQSLAIPVPNESGEDEPLEEKRKRHEEQQDKHTEELYRKHLAQQSGRATSAQSTPSQSPQ